MDYNNCGSGFILGLFTGVIIGGVAGILLAPKPGAQTRTELVEMGNTWRTRADEMAADMRNKGMPDMSGVSQRVGPAVDSLRERGASTAEAVRITARSGARRVVSPDKGESSNDAVPNTAEGTPAQSENSENARES